MRLSCAVLLLFLLQWWAPAPAMSMNAITQVRLGRHATYTRLVFDLREPASYQIVESNGAKGVVAVQFPSLQVSAEQRVLRFRKLLVREVHFEVKPTHVLARVLLEPSARIERHFSLHTPPRVVIDVAKTEPPITTPTLTTPRAASEDQPPDVASLNAPAILPEAEQPPPPAPPQPASDQPTPGLPASPAEGLVQATPPPASEALTLSPLALLQQAERYWQQRQFNNAEEAYTTFLIYFPYHAQNHLIAARLADIAREQRKYQEALDAYAKVVATYPGSEGAVISQIRMAELHQENHGLIPRPADPSYDAYTQPLQALPHLIRAYPFSPLIDAVRFTTGLLYLQRHDLQPALEMFQGLLQKPLSETLRQEVRGKFRQVLARFLATRRQEGAYVEVLRTYFAAKGLLPEAEATHTDFVFPVAASYAHLGLVEEAQGLLQSIHQRAEVPQERARVTVALAALLVDNGQATAVPELLLPVEQFPEPDIRGQALLVLGKAAQQTQRLSDAVRYLQMGAKLPLAPADQAASLSLLGQVYEAQGQIRQSTQAFQRCAELTVGEGQRPLPSAEDCLSRAGTLLVREEQYQQALGVYQQILKAFPQSPQYDAYLFRLAENHYALADIPQTITALTTLRDRTHDQLWQQAASAYLDDLQWQKRFRERLAVFHNRLMR